MWDKPLQIGDYCQPRNNIYAPAVLVVDCDEETVTVAYPAKRPLTDKLCVKEVALLRATVRRAVPTAQKL